MKTGFLILNYNSSEQSIILARKIACFEEVDEVIIVDNNSSEESKAILDSVNDTKIKIVYSLNNRGYSAGNNIGLELFSKKDFDFVAVANPDIDISHDSFVKTLNYLMEGTYSVLSPVEYNGKDEIVIPVTTKRMDYTNDLLDCFYFGRKHNKKRLAISLNNEIEIQNVQMIRGSFLFVNLQDLKQIGLFDENVFLYCEERILSKRMEDSQMKMGLVTNAIYHHDHSASIAKTYRKLHQIRILYKSRLYYNIRYNNVHTIRLVIMKICMRLSLIEYKILYRFKKQ